VLARRITSHESLAGCSGARERAGAASSQKSLSDR
jgi:hypothetical protein